jgi:dihydrofolate reductase
MRKLVLFMHCSLDGFVAGPNGEMGWIHVDDEIFDYVGGYTGKADEALYGRVTYEMMEAYWPNAGKKPDASKHDMQHSQWYNNVPKIVLSDSLKGRHISNTRIISGNMAEQIRKIKQEPGQLILIFGSPSASHSLMQDSLIDEYWLFVNPVVLGTGVPLFKNIPGRVKLKFLESKVFSSGVVMLHYSL